jgi:hypothetical protein
LKSADFIKCRSPGRCATDLGVGKEAKEDVAALGVAVLVDPYLYALDIGVELLGRDNRLNNLESN